MIKNIIQTIILFPVILVLAIILAAGIAICLLGVTLKHGAKETADVLTILKEVLENIFEEVLENTTEELQERE